MKRVATPVDEGSVAVELVHQYLDTVAQMTDYEAVMTQFGGPRRSGNFP